jgi:hypothetical protein
MPKSFRSIVLVVSGVSLLLSGCASNVPQPEPTFTLMVLPEATVDAQATVDASVVGTMEAQTSLQATIDTAVSATLAANPAEPEGEAELAAEVETAVSDADTASTAVADATTTATADGTLTAEEIAAIEALVYEAEVALYYADSLIETYTSYYGDLAEESLALLNEVEDDLDAIITALDEVVGYMEAGAETATEAISQLETAAAQASQLAQNASSQAEQWQSQVQIVIEQRQQNLLDVEPGQLAADRAEALQLAADYIQLVREGAADGKFTFEEMLPIAELGARASGSLQAQGGPALANFAGVIDQVTLAVGGGQLGQVQSLLGSLEGGLPDLPRP